MSDLSDLLDDFPPETKRRQYQRRHQCEAMTSNNSMRCQLGAPHERRGRRVCGFHANSEFPVTFYDQLVKNPS